MIVITEQTLIDTKAVAALLGEQPGALGRARFQNVGLPYVRSGHRAGYKLVDVLALVRARAETEASLPGERWARCRAFPSYEVSTLYRVRRAAPIQGARPGELISVGSSGGVLLRRNNRVVYQTVAALAASAFPRADLDEAAQSLLAMVGAPA